MAKGLKVKFVYQDTSEERSARIMLEIFDLLLAGNPAAEPSINKTNKQDERQKSYETIN